RPIRQIRGLISPRGLWRHAPKRKRRERLEYSSLATNRWATIGGDRTGFRGRQILGKMKRGSHPPGNLSLIGEVIVVMRNGVSQLLDLISEDAEKFVPSLRVERWATASEIVLEPHQLHHTYLLVEV